MGRAISSDNNVIVPSGIIKLISPVTIDKKKYRKVWAPFWDVIVKDTKIVDKKELEKKENWIWHILYKDTVLFHIPGEKMQSYEVADVPPFDDNTIWIPDVLRKDIKKRMKKNKAMIKIKKKGQR